MQSALDYKRGDKLNLRKVCRNGTREKRMPAVSAAIWEAIRTPSAPTFPVKCEIVDTQPRAVRTLKNRERKIGHVNGRISVDW